MTTTLIVQEVVSLRRNGWFRKLKTVKSCSLVQSSDTFAVGFIVYNHNTLRRRQTDRWRYHANSPS